MQLLAIFSKLLYYNFYVSHVSVSFSLGPYCVEVGDLAEYACEESVDICINFRVLPQVNMSQVGKKLQKNGPSSPTITTLDHLPWLIFLCSITIPELHRTPLHLQIADNHCILNWLSITSENTTSESGNNKVFTDYVI